LYDPLKRKSKSVKIDSNEIEKFYICRSKKKISSIIYLLLTVIYISIITIGCYLSNKIKNISSKKKFNQSENISRVFHCNYYFFYSFIIIIQLQFDYIYIYNAILKKFIKIYINKKNKNKKIKINKLIKYNKINIYIYIYRYN